jgi:hypothetical protein
LSRTDRGLIALYILIALVALVATWSQNLAYFASSDAGGLVRFIEDTRVNPASRSITADIGLVFYAAAVFMVVEARRLGVRFVWLYVVLGLMVAISVTFPLFLAARQAALARPERPGARPGAIDIAGLGALALMTIGLTAYVMRGG